MSAGTADVLAAAISKAWGAHPVATLGGSGAAGIAAARMDVARAAELNGPVSGNVHILSYVVVGEREHRIWNDGRPVFHGTVPDRSINIVRAGVAPRAVVSASVDVLHVYMPHDLLARQVRETGVHGGRVELIDPLSAHDPVFAALADALLGAMAKDRPMNRLFADHLGTAMAVYVLQHHSNLRGSREPVFKPVKGGLAPWQLRRAVERMGDMPADEPSLAELAAAVGLSPAHFCRAFKTSTGLPPYRWRIARRLDRARKLLASTDLPVADVAAAVGYDDPSQLAAAFRKALGVSPTQYRRERRW